MQMALKVLPTFRGSYSLCMNNAAVFFFFLKEAEHKHIIFKLTSSKFL